MKKTLEEILKEKKILELKNKKLEKKNKELQKENTFLKITNKEKGLINKSLLKTQEILREFSRRSTNEDLNETNYKEYIGLIIEGIADVVGFKRGSYMSLVNKNDRSIPFIDAIVPLNKKLEVPFWFKNEEFIGVSEKYKELMLGKYLFGREEKPITNLNSKNPIIQLVNGDIPIIQTCKDETLLSELVKKGIITKDFVQRCTDQFNQYSEETKKRYNNDSAYAIKQIAVKVSYFSSKTESRQTFGVMGFDMISEDKDPTQPFSSTTLGMVDLMTAYLSDKLAELIVKGRKDSIMKQYFTSEQLEDIKFDLFLFKKKIREGVNADLCTLMADIEGFTKFSEGKAPEEVTERVHIVMDSLTRITSKYGGLMHDFIGDEVVCHFQDDYDSEGHIILRKEEKGIKAAIEMQYAFKEINNNFEKEKEADSSKYGKFNGLKIGLSSGMVTVADIGSGNVKYKIGALGQKVNEAKKIQDLARGSKIAIDKKIYDIIKKESINHIKELGKRNGKNIYQILY